MVYHYNKLVRDNIPDILTRKGKKVVIHRAVTDEEYWMKLKEKLQEEINEFGQKEDIETLSDVFEVLDAMIELKNFDRKELSAMRENKNIEFGRFNERLILNESDEEVGGSTAQL